MSVSLKAPPGLADAPAFDRGWRTTDGATAPFLSYVEGAQGANWSESLEQLHEQSSRSHFIDVWTRRALLSRLGPLDPGAVIVDAGCSSGYLLEDLRAAHPSATLIGVDLVASGLRRAHRLVPDAWLLQADVGGLPLADASVDAAVSANLLEHVADDQRALQELFRVLAPGAQTAIVVPAGRELYDYYDRFLGHERRYARGELAGRGARAGFEVQEDFYLGGLLYPPMWLVKQRNRRRYGHLQGAALKDRVASDIASTQSSRIGRLACDLERRLLGMGVRMPIGIRGLTVLRKPADAR